VPWGQTGEFHRGCDNKGTWSVIFFTFDTGNSFAFATDQVWGSESGWRSSDLARVFVFSEDVSALPAMFSPNEGGWYTSYDTFWYGPTVGYGHDLYVNLDELKGYSARGSWFDAHAASRGGYLAGAYDSWRLVDMAAYFYAPPPPEWPQV
jgi:hypothetical protein